MDLDPGILDEPDEEPVKDQRGRSRYHRAVRKAYSIEATSGTSVSCITNNFMRQVRVGNARSFPLLPSRP